MTVTETAAPPGERPSALRTRRGALTLALLLLVQFLDFLDVSIVNVALPSIKHDLDFSEQSLQWVVSGYVLTYGGFLLLGGRAADLVGRRRILVGGLILFALASLVGGVAHDDGLLVAARLAQGVGAAHDVPGRALDPDHHLHQHARPQHRTRRLGGRPRARRRLRRRAQRRPHPGARLALDLLPQRARRDPRRPRRARAPSAANRAAAGGAASTSGAVLVTAGMLLLVYTLVEAPDVGWGATATIGGLAGAAVLLAAFVANERRARNPLVPFSIFRIKGLAAANVTQLITFSGLYSMFFFLSLYMQNVLGYSPIHTGLAYLPLTAGFMISAGIATPLVPRIGTKPVIVGGALVAAGGLYFLSHVPVDGAFRRRPATGDRRRRARSRRRLHRRHHRRDRGRADRPRRHRLRAPERLDAVRRRVRARRPLRGGHRAHRRRPRLGPRPSPGPHRRLPARLPDRRPVRTRRSARRLPGEQRPLSREGERGRTSRQPSPGLVPATGDLSSE